MRKSNETVVKKKSLNLLIYIQSSRIGSTGQILFTGQSLFHKTQLIILLIAVSKLIREGGLGRTTKNRGLYGDISYFGWFSHEVKSTGGNK